MTPIFEVRPIEYTDVAAFRKEHEESLFENCVTLNLDTVFSETERENITRLEKRYRENHIFINVGAFLDNKLIGVSSGGQDIKGMFNMSWSAVLPQHRGRGAYTAMMNAVIAIAKEKGFIALRSRHLASNNAVIIPKLRAGFAITALEVSEQHGSMVHLTLYLNDKHSDLYQFRVGSKTLRREDTEKFRNFFSKE